MTPAKLLILVGANRELLALKELPLAQLQAMFYNANRDTGDVKEGRPAAPLKGPAEFQVYARKRKTLAAKDEDLHALSLRGAMTDKSAWEAWSKGKNPPTVRVRKR